MIDLYIKCIKIFLLHAYTFMPESSDSPDLQRVKDFLYKSPFLLHDLLELGTIYDCDWQPEVAVAGRIQREVLTKWAKSHPNPVTAPECIRRGILMDECILQMEDHFPEAAEQARIALINALTTLPMCALAGLTPKVMKERTHINMAEMRLIVECMQPFRDALRAIVSDITRIG
jgi:hypothetical protein